MLAEIALALNPLKMFFAGAIFLVIAWFATKQVLALGIAGVTAGEAGVNLLRSITAPLHEPTIVTSHPAMVKAAEFAGIPVGGNYIFYALIANASLALAAYFFAKGIRAWLIAQQIEHRAALELAAKQAEARRRLSGP